MIDASSFIQATIKESAPSIKEESAYKDTPATSNYIAPKEPGPEEAKQTEQKVDDGPDIHKISQLAKAERRLSKQKAEAEAIISRADAVKGAFEETDLIAALTKLGLSPTEIYHKLTDNALKNPPPEEDEVHKELREVKEQTKSYAEKMEAMERQLQEEKEQTSHMQAIQQHVAPVINENPDAYEVAINIYGGKDEFISEVYSSMYKEYINSGTTYTAKQAADAIEEYWAGELSNRLEQASKMGKFAKYFNKAEPESNKISNNPAYLTQAERFSKILAAHPETSNDSPATDNHKLAKTLTNNMNVTPTANVKYNSPLLDRNSYINNLLKKFNQ